MTVEPAVKSIRAVERAIDVLNCFSRDNPVLSVTDLQHMLRLSRPTLYRLLHTLEKKGLVRSHGEPRRYELDFGVVEIGGSWLGKGDLARTAQPFLAELWRATDETVALLVPAPPGEKICVTEIQSRQPLTFTRGAGFRESVRMGSSGKVMLAHMESEQVTAALAGLDDDAGRAALAADLEAIRRDGFAVSSGEILAGAIAIAAPVFDGTGAIAASVCVFGPEARLKGATREQCVRRVCAAARNLSVAIGHRPETAAAEAAE